MASQADKDVEAQNQLAQWINDAGVSEGNKKAEFLRKINEVLFHRAPQLVPSFLENILSYSSDKSTEVKKQVIIFVEELSKFMPELLPKCVGTLRVMLRDNVIAVQKRVIQGSSIVYRYMLRWIKKGEASLENMQFVWEQLTDLKLNVLNMIDSDNEGIRTHSIKFLEEVVMLQSPSHGSVQEEDDFSLESLPDNLPFINKKVLEDESETIFTLLIKFHNSQHISSVNLMACMTTLCLLAKYRPKYLKSVIEALGDLHTTLPPTLSQSQVNSVRKHLKMLLTTLVKNPSCSDMLPQLVQLLVDLGMTSHELNKIVPKEKRQKRFGDTKLSDVPSKKFKVDSPPPPYEPTARPTPVPAPVPAPVPPPTVDRYTCTEDTLFNGLCSIENVVSLITATLMNNLPKEIPPNFAKAYKPIPNAGSKEQKKSLAKLLISVVKGDTPTPVPPPHPSLSEIAAKIPRPDDEKLTLKNALSKLNESTKAERHKETVATKLLEDARQDFLKEDERLAKESGKEKPQVPPTPTVPKLKHRVKILKLQEITRPIPKEIKEKLIIQAVQRILNAEKDAIIGGVEHIRNKLITIFASSYTPELRELVLSFILADPVNRVELAITWLYEEYAFMQGFSNHPVTLTPKVEERDEANYNQLLCALITQIGERAETGTDATREPLLRRIYLDAPLVTDEAIEFLKHLITEDKMVIMCMDLLEELCITRPPRAHKTITALLFHVLNDNDEIRETAINMCIKLYKKGSEALKKVVEKHAKLYLGFISMNSPPFDLFIGDSRVKHKWTDHLYKQCLNLVMALFPEKEELIIEVARVYGKANAEAKRCVLRCVEAPARLASAGPPRPAFLALLDECPRGAETLLTRLIHILTERTPPTPELVSKVRNLYATRVSDVRFLIPVLNGLSKKEIIAALPKLIKLNPVVVKEVFNKLFGSGLEDEDNCPISPAELLVELHLIDLNKADLKYIIKATALCFAEKQTFTQEVVGVVLQALMEEEEIPVLMMRSVLQALTLYPALSGLVLNIMQRLIEKEVWSNKVAWEGWIKCCERTAPASCAVVTSLPAAPLAACLSSAPVIAQAVLALPPSEKAKIPAEVLAQIAAKQASSPPDEPAAPFDANDETEFGQTLAANPIEPMPPGME